MKSMFPHALVLAFTALMATSGEARAQQSPTFFQLQGPQSSIAYTIHHKLHTVVGTSRQAGGKAALLPDGTLQVMVRAPVTSFDSRNSGRDEHMWETMEATRYPEVTFKGVGKVVLPTTFPANITVQVRGELEFHGRRRPETISVQAVFDSERHLRATAAFDISLGRYEVERPSLMLMPIEDTCHIALDLDMRKSE